MKSDYVMYLVVIILFVVFCYSFDFALTNSPLLGGN